jgi:hypothetical protein
MHHYITAQIARDRHQERLAEAARERLAREAEAQRATREGDRAPRQARGNRRIRLVPRLGLNRQARPA